MVDTEKTLNKNQRQLQFSKAEKIINNQEKHRFFTNGKTYKKVVEYIHLFQDSVRKIKNSLDVKKELEKDANLKAMYDFLEKAENLTTSHPPLNKESQRFGNTAFRTWYDDLEKLFDSDFAKSLDSAFPVESTSTKLSEEIKPYISECFGNSKRIDYGTGHELNFFCVILILTEIGFFSKNLVQNLIQIIFKKYLSVCKTLQTLYNLEPAGSKGVYGLDDYHFLCFIFGAAELIDNTEKMTPKEIQENLTRLEELSTQYMFFDAVYYNVKSKNGQLSQHSPVLFQISNVPLWEKVAKGLIFMYEDEVLKKIVVSQHFYFGSILTYE